MPHSPFTLPVRAAALRVEHELLASLTASVVESGVGGEPGGVSDAIAELQRDERRLHARAPWAPSGGED